MKKDVNLEINFFQRYLTLWVIACMLIGITLGHFLPGMKEALNQLEYAGIMTRLFMVRKKGAEYFEQTSLHKFDSATTVGFLLTLILIFMFQGEVVLNNPLHIILIAVPLIIQTFFIFFLAFGICRLIKLSYDIAAPAGMIGASNFFELSVAVAVALFGTSSSAALATTVGVLTEVPVMLTLVKIANKSKEKFIYE